MKKKIYKSLWSRKNHFELYNSFEEPLFGLVANVNCTKAYQKIKEENISFYLYYLHLILKTINSIEEFRLRIIENDVYLFDTIHVSIHLKNTCKHIQNKDTHIPKDYYIQRYFEVFLRKKYFWFVYHWLQSWRKHWIT